MSVSTPKLEVHSVPFSPEVLARISPSLSLQRHLSLGIRPSLRGFEEFRDVAIDQETMSRYHELDKIEQDSGILGSNVLRCGNTVVITTITGGIIEQMGSSFIGLDNPSEEDLFRISEERDDLAKFTSIYPVVEVERGRMGACTDEEMNVSQKLHDSILYSRLLPKKSLVVSPCARVMNEDGTLRIITTEEASETGLESSIFKPHSHWSYVLYAKIIVFSRTGPVFDLCWNSLTYALQNVKLPRTFIDERAIDLKMNFRSRGKSSTVHETYEILCDSKVSTPLILNENNIAFASNYGIIDLDPEAQLEDIEIKKIKKNNSEVDVDMNMQGTVLLADIDTEAEEASILSRISVIGDGQGRYKQIDIMGSDSKITQDMIKRALNLSTLRSSDLLSRVE